MPPQAARASDITWQTFPEVGTAVGGSTSQSGWARVTARVSDEPALFGAGEGRWSVRPDGIR
jgi:hypothetical protein